MTASAPSDIRGASFMLEPRRSAGEGAATSAWQEAAEAAAMRRPVGMWMRGGPRSGKGSAPTYAKVSRRLTSCWVDACGCTRGSCTTYRREVKLRAWFACAYHQPSCSWILLGGVKAWCAHVGQQTAEMGCGYAMGSCRALSAGLSEEGVSMKDVKGFYINCSFSFNWLLEKIKKKGDKSLRKKRNLEQRKEVKKMIS